MAKITFRKNMFVFVFSELSDPERFHLLVLTA